MDGQADSLYTINQTAANRTQNNGAPRPRTAQDRTGGWEQNIFAIAITILSPFQLSRWRCRSVSRIHTRTSCLRRQCVVELFGVMHQ